MKESEAVFNYWNTLPDHKNWRTHRTFTPGMFKAVGVWLKEGYTPSYLCESIKNYYTVRTTKGTWWHDVCNKKWDFETFFSGGSKKEMYNWKRFEPERFELYDFFTDSAKQKYIVEKRKEQELERQYLEMRDYLFENKEKWPELERSYPDAIRRARQEAV